MAKILISPGKYVQGAGEMKKLYDYDAYVVVTKSCIRIALCAINEEEARKMPRIILKALREL